MNSVGLLTKQQVKLRASLCIGFTLMELLLVIAIISILASLLLPAITSAKAKARTVGCLSNLKQFGAAFELYAVDHSDAVLPNKDGQDAILGQAWVEGWEGLPGPDCTNVVYLQRSLIGPYLTAVSIWSCPSSSQSAEAGVGTRRVRTVSLNCFMGCPTNIPGVLSYRRLGQIARPSPSDALVFVDERADTINDGSFAMQWDFDPKRPSAWVLRDKPSVVHNKACIFTYADGHAAVHRWQDRRTLYAPRDDSILAGDIDVSWLQEHATWREQ